MNSEGDFQKLSFILANQKTRKIKINSISMTPAAGAINLTMNGVVSSKGFNEARIDFQSFVNPLKQVKGMNLSRHTLEIQNKSFIIVGTYKSG